MNYIVIEQYMDLEDKKCTLKNEKIAMFESLGNALDYCRDCNKKNHNIFFVEEE
jgi:hypothetical protein